MASVKFASKCKVCNNPIAKGSGDVRKVQGAWSITCNTHKPQPRRLSVYEYNQKKTGHRQGCECKLCMWDEY